VVAALAGSTPSPCILLYEVQTAPLVTVGQAELIQIAWKSGLAIIGTDALGEQRMLKVLVRAMPTAVTSSVVTPKEVAARATSWMKYPISSGPKFIMEQPRR